jgi:hypothetical protein
MSLSWLPLLLATGLEKNPSKAKGARNNAKPGPKRQKPGKGVTAVQLVGRNKVAALAWMKKCAHLLVLLAGRQGQAYEYGAVSMALRVVLNLVDEASLTWDSENLKIKGLRPVFARASTLTGMAVTKLKEVFYHYLENQEILVSDPSIRGRGSPNCNRTALRNLSPAHDAAIRVFVDYRNSSVGAGKVWYTKRH